MIQEQLQQEILTRIDRLAEKLGVTAEYLWPHLVRYEFGRAIGMLVVAAIGIVVMRITWRLCAKVEDEDAEIGLGIVTGLVGVATLILCVMFAVDGIPALIAPEAAAFKALLP